MKEPEDKPDFIVEYTDLPPLGEHRMNEEELIKYMLDNKLPMVSCSCGCTVVKNQLDG